MRKVTKSYSQFEHMSRRQSLATSTVVKLCHGAAPVLVVGSPF